MPNPSANSAPSCRDLHGLISFYPLTEFAWSWPPSFLLWDMDTASWLALLLLLLLLAIRSIPAARLIFSGPGSDGVRSALGEEEDSSQNWTSPSAHRCCSGLSSPRSLSPLLPLPQSRACSSSSLTPDTLSFRFTVFFLWRPCLEHITNLHSCLSHLPPLSIQSHLLRELAPALPTV